MAFTREHTYIPRAPEGAWRYTSVQCDRCGLTRDLEERYQGEHTRPRSLAFYPGFPWTPISVEAGEPGEEGHVIIERIYCEPCFDEVCESLVQLGLSNHYHGSTNFLEDSRCPGYETPNLCPTPQHTRYGMDAE